MYKLLDNPLFFSLQQHILAAGAGWTIPRHLNELISKLPRAKLLLDVACGPSSWLFRVGLKPIGLDLSMAYSRAYLESGNPSIVASAIDMPFPSHSIDGVWSIGLLHHLPDEMAEAALKECLRICKSPGYVVVCDAVLPRSTMTRPLAALIRSKDRGKFMRTQDELERLLPARSEWSVQRWTYSLTGLEMLTMYNVKR